MQYEENKQPREWAKSIGKHKTLYEGVEVLAGTVSMDVSYALHSAFVNMLLNLTTMRINMTEAEYSLNAQSRSTLHAMARADVKAMKYAVGLVDGYASLQTILNGSDIASMPMATIMRQMANSDQAELSAQFSQIIRGVYMNGTPLVPGDFQEALTMMGSRAFAPHNVQSKLIEHMIALDQTTSKLDLLFSLDSMKQDAVLIELLDYVEAYSTLTSAANQEALTFISPQFKFLLAAYSNYKKGQFAHRNDMGESYDGLTFTLSLAALHDNFRLSELGQAITRVLIASPSRLDSDPRFSTVYATLGKSTGYAIDASTPVFDFSAAHIVDVLSYITNLDLHLSRTQSTDYAAFSNRTTNTFNSPLPKIGGLDNWCTVMRQLCMYTMLITPSSQEKMRSTFHPTVQAAMTKLRTTEQITENMREANFYLNAALAADKYVVEVLKGIFFSSVPKIDVDYVIPSASKSASPLLMYRENKQVRSRYKRAADYLNTIQLVKADGVLEPNSNDSFVVLHEGIVKPIPTPTYKLIQELPNSAPADSYELAHTIPTNRKFMIIPEIRDFITDIGDVLEYVESYKTSPYSSAIHQWLSPIMINHVNLCFNDYAKDIGGDFIPIHTKELFTQRVIEVACQGSGPVFDRAETFTPFSTTLGMPRIQSTLSPLFLTHSKLTSILNTVQHATTSNWDFTESSYSLIIVDSPTQAREVKLRFPTANVFQIQDEERLIPTVMYKFGRIPLELTRFEQILSSASTNLNIIPVNALTPDTQAYYYTPGVSRWTFRPNDPANPYLLLGSLGYGQFQSIDELRLFRELDYLFTNLITAPTISDLILVDTRFIVIPDLLRRHNFNYVRTAVDTPKNRVKWTQFKITNTSFEQLRYMRKITSIIEALQEHHPMMSMLAIAKDDSRIFLPHVVEIPTISLNDIEIIKDEAETGSVPIIA